MVVQFEYFFFPLLSYDEVRALFDEKFPNEYDDDFIRKAFEAYEEHCTHLARTFYSSQYRYHETIVSEAFIRQENIPKELDDRSFSELEYDWGYDELSERYEIYKEISGLNEHLGLLEEAFKKRISKSRSQPITSDSAAEDYLRRLFSPDPQPELYYSDICELWFTKMMATDATTIAHLRALPYEEYLKTTYWKRLRALMLLLYHRSCQSKRCNTGWMEPYFGTDTRYLHIHHMTYKRRGHEQLQDLRVLCDDCHRIAHSDKAESLGLENPTTWLLFAP